MKNIIKNSKSLLFFDNKIITKLKAMAFKSNNKRARICCHLSTENKINEMIIVLMKKSYIAPHIHPKNKSESYTVLKGRMNVYIFNKKGKFKKVVKMGDINSGKNFFYRMSKGFWHMPMATSKWCIYHETYSGPFRKKNDVKYAPWAPKEEDQKKINYFLKNLKSIR
jgi:cupin fold WbuC family metalloprotein|tara:strand:- start:51 stop:551 length:501 start_codon:yes stop_codon:yes gene_type:complete